MELINKFELSLGLEPYDMLGFDSEDQLNMEIMKLIEVRPECKNYINIIND